MDHFLQQCVEIIDRHGWMVQGVFPTMDQPGPQWCYTIGLTFLNHPELIVFGLPPQVGQGILNHMGSRIREDCLRYEPDNRYAGLVRGHDIEIIRALPAAHQTYMGVACALLGGSEKFSTVQVTWPDRAGYLPSDPTYDQSFHQTQPLLNQLVVIANHPKRP